MPEALPIPQGSPPWSYQIWERKKTRLFTHVAWGLGLLVFALVMFGIPIYKAQMLGTDMLVPWLGGTAALALAAIAAGFHAVRLGRREAKSLLDTVVWHQLPKAHWFAANSSGGRELVPLPGSGGALAPMPYKEPAELSPRARAPQTGPWAPCSPPTL